MGGAECFGAIAHEHEGFGSDVRNLIVILCAEKNDLIFFDDTLFALESFDGCFALEREKRLGGHMIVHVGVVAWQEIKYPRPKTVGAEERDKSLIFLFGRAQGVV